MFNVVSGSLASLADSEHASVRALSRHRVPQSHATVHVHKRQSRRDVSVVAMAMCRDC